MDTLEVLKIAEKAIPRSLPFAVREDAVQDLVVAILEKKVTILPTSEEVREIISHAWQQSPSRFAASLDRPFSSEDSRTLLDMPLSPLVSVNVKSPRTPKVLKQLWYQDQAYQGVGRPKTWYHTTEQLVVWRQDHSLEACGIGGSWIKKHFQSLHALCPGCSHLMHIHASRPSQQKFMWVCRKCDSHVVYKGQKFWSIRQSSPMRNGKRLHERLA